LRLRRERQSEILFLFEKESGLSYFSYRSFIGVNMVPDWLKPRVGKDRLMYLAHPTRKIALGRRLKDFAKGRGYSPVDPFDLGEDLEFGLVGRKATLDLDLCVQHGCGVTGVFGISEGVMGEVRDRLGWDPGKNIRVFRRDEAGEFDEKWDEEYKRLKKKYGDVLAELRGSNTLIVLVGPSAVGKTYWSEALKSHFGDSLERVKNTTTRPPRDEKDHDYYYRVSREAFKMGIENRAFLEHVNYLGEYYGSSLDEAKKVLRSSNGIFALTPEGAKALHECSLEINLKIILLKPESESVLVKNLKRRGEVAPDAVAKKIQKAKDFVLPKEVEHEKVLITGTKYDRDKIFGAVTPYLK